MAREREKFSTKEFEIIGSYPSMDTDIYTVYGYPTYLRSLNSIGQSRQRKIGN